jgi:hypothetical protein
MVLLETRGRQPLPLSSLNHISRNCTDINASVAFYMVSFQLTGSVPLSFLFVDYVLNWRECDI